MGSTQGATTSSRSGACSAGGSAAKAVAPGTLRRALPAQPCPAPRGPPTRAPAAARPLPRLGSAHPGPRHLTPSSAPRGIDTRGPDTSPGLRPPEPSTPRAPGRSPEASTPHPGSAHPRLRHLTPELRSPEASTPHPELRSPEASTPHPAVAKCDGLSAVPRARSPVTAAADSVGRCDRRGPLPHPAVAKCDGLSAVPRARSPVTAAADSVGRCDRRGHYLTQPPPSATAYRPCLVRGRRSPPLPIPSADVTGGNPHPAVAKCDCLSAVPRARSPVTAAADSISRCDRRGSLPHPPSVVRVLSRRRRELQRAAPSGPREPQSGSSTPPRRMGVLVLGGPRGSSHPLGARSPALSISSELSSAYGDLRAPPSACALPSSPAP